MTLPKNKQLLQKLERLERQEWDEKRARSLLAYKFPRPNAYEETVSQMLQELMEEFKVHSMDDPMVEQFSDVIVSYLA